MWSQTGHCLGELAPWESQSSELCQGAIWSRGSCLEPGTDVQVIPTQAVRVWDSPPLRYAKNQDSGSCSWLALHLPLRGVCPPMLMGAHHHAQPEHPLNTWWDAVKGTEIVGGPPALTQSGRLLSGQTESPVVLGGAPEARSASLQFKGLCASQNSASSDRQLEASS